MKADIKRVRHTEEKERVTGITGMERENSSTVIVYRLISMLYMIVLTGVVSYFTSKVIGENMWESERVVMSVYIAAAFLFSFIYLAVTERKLLKFLFMYHFLLAGVYVLSITPVEFRAYTFIPMAAVAICNFKCGLVVNMTTCSILMLGMTDYPLYVLAAVLIINGGTACFAVWSFNDTVKNVLGLIMHMVMLIISVFYFRYYCEGTGLYYETKSFVICSLLTSFLAVFAANCIRQFFGGFLSEKTSELILMRITKEKSEPITYMRDKSAAVYYHSMEVAELARLGAKRINADYNLAYAGGLFHDLGKVEGPEYIKEGLKLANRYNIPRDVKAIMIEHNVKARLPKTKEAAIVMLADTAVSAIEYVKGQMDKKDISEKSIIENALNKRLVTNTLTKSGLTIAEFEIIRDAFASLKERQ